MIPFDMIALTINPCSLRDFDVLYNRKSGRMFINNPIDHGIIELSSYSFELSENGKPMLRINTTDILCPKGGIRSPNLYLDELNNLNNKSEVSISVEDWNVLIGESQ